MPAFHEIDGCGLSNNRSDYTEDVFLEHSNNNTEETERTDSNDSEDSKDSKNSDDSDKEISEDDKLSSFKYYEIKKTVPSTQKDHLIAPNFFQDAKGPDGSPAVATRQACYDGAMGARGIYSYQGS
ncbi:hypothetical protein ACJ72_01879 [Emergomyces africanus]|uniref:Uncharacterized protein n=1 Tax=Emergomyces africanus TaxID=1955775 RepID=A0A1B7P409_9EURO|nr:hypothetical protein ACJ72_01879 [Emergomyces africanus]